MRDAVMAEYFTPNRLSVAFMSGARQFAAQVVPEWTFDGATVAARVAWEAPVSTSIDAARLFDGDVLLETYAFVDESGRPDFTRLLPGMKLDYDLIVSLVD